MCSVNIFEHIFISFNRFELLYFMEVFAMGYATNCFAKRLKEVREAAGMTQAQLASELNVSRGAISYYEKGERTPDIEFLDSFSDYFNIPLDFAMGFTDNLKVEHRNMYELYGLSDAACNELDQTPEIGHLISEIIEHKSFFDLLCLYRGIIKNYDSFDTTQCGYIAFLISDTLNKIILDSINNLHYAQYTEEQLDALRTHWKATNEELDKILKEYDRREAERAKVSAAKTKIDIEQTAAEESSHWAAIDSVYEKFCDTTEPAQSSRDVEHLIGKNK